MKRDIKALSKVDKQDDTIDMGDYTSKSHPMAIVQNTDYRKYYRLPDNQRFEYCQREGAIKGRERTHQGKAYNGKTPREALLSSKSV